MSTQYVTVNGNVYELKINIACSSKYLVIHDALYEEIFLYFNSGNKLIDLPKDKCMHHYYAFATSNKILNTIDNYWLAPDCLLCAKEEKNKRIAPANSNTFIRYRSLTINSDLPEDIVKLLERTTSAGYEKMIYHVDGIMYLIPNQLINHVLTLCMKHSNTVVYD